MFPISDGFFEVLAFVPLYSLGAAIKSIRRAIGEVENGHHDDVEDGEKFQEKVCCVRLKSQIKLTPAARPRRLFLIKPLLSLRLVDHQRRDREQKEPKHDESSHSLAEGSASSL